MSFLEWFAAAGALFILNSASFAENRVVSVPAPKGSELSNVYRVTVNGQPVSTYAAPVWYPTYVKPFGGPYSFANFDFEGTAHVEITTDKPLDHAVVRPISLGIHPIVQGKTMRFDLKKPCRLSIEPDAKNGPLLLFANPLERDKPKPNGLKVKYYGPGIHQAGAIELRDGETLYIAAGAVVKGGVHAQGTNIRICGRGILDGGSYERFKGPLSVIMHLDHCSNTTVEGITLKDSWSWTFMTTACTDIKIRNVKICSARCENNDGFDFVNSSRIAVSDCFVRSDDDCVAPKGMGENLGAEPYPPVEDIVMERCVLWSDRAHIWRLGCESRASAMRRMVFRDIDVIHYTDPTCPVISVQPAEGMTMEDVRFENIRINHEGQAKFIELDPHATIWAKTQKPGIIRNILFKDISLTGGFGSPLGSVVFRGVDAEHPIENVVFDNVTRQGERLEKGSPEIETSGEVRNMTYR